MKRPLKVFIGAEIPFTVQISINISLYTGLNWIIDRFNLIVQLQGIDQGQMAIESSTLGVQQHCHKGFNVQGISVMTRTLEKRALSCK